MNPSPDASQPVTAIPISQILGIPFTRACQLAKLGITTVGDIFLYAPSRYEDRREIKKIATLKKGDSALVSGTVLECGIKQPYRRGKLYTKIIISDETAKLHCYWWNQSWPANRFKPGQKVILFGKITKQHPAEMSSPEFRINYGPKKLHLDNGHIIPIYPLTEGLSQRALRAIIKHVLDMYLNKLPEGPEYDPELEFPTRPQAIRMLHFPSLPGEGELGRKRLAMDELFNLQLDIQRRRKNLEQQSHGIHCPGDNHLIRPFLKHLPFTLTPSQTEVLREMRHDMNSGLPMRRLLQGDVGSGKTVVAACVALMLIEGNYNVVLMAPTEILALQHLHTFQQWFTPLGIPVRLWTGHIKQEKEKTPLLPTTPEQTTPQTPQSAGIVIGTHALIEDSFQIERLGLVIIDEQHKFGVDQRDRLLKKGNWPHLLVMTATPIPRTLGLTLYGELDISTIKHPPSGRGTIRTYIRKRDKWDDVWKFVCKQIAKGRQAYVVYPLINESENPDVKAVEAEFINIQKIIAPAKAGLLHGRMKAEEKEYIMKQFANNQVQVLVSTTVVEVGVDVSNATIMIIENAEHFGLAQLHQLRGRIGRGKENSHCILILGDEAEESADRLKILEKTNDGFQIAEEDLRQRGPGDFLGDRQHGMPSFHFANLTTDYALAQRAKIMAQAIVRGQ